MSQRSIPPHLEPAIKELIEKKYPARKIKEWLKREHDIDTSHMAVHRLAERLRYEDGAVADLAAELEESRLRAGTHIRALEALCDEFCDRALLAQDGDPEQGLEPDPKMAVYYYNKLLRAMGEWARAMVRLEKWVASKSRTEEEQPAPPPTPESKPQAAASVGTDLRAFILDAQRKLNDVRAARAADEARPNAPAVRSGL